MTRRLLSIAILAGALAASSAASTSAALALTPVGRFPFPERGFVVDLPHGAPATDLHATVRENGSAISGVKLTPVGSAGISYGTILAVDASDSMHGAPSAAAMAAARSFAARRNPNQQIGVITFNGSVNVLQLPTSNGTSLDAALAQSPTLSYGTRIYDALIRSLVLFEHGHISSGSIVLLSDGTDLGSKSSLENVLTRATRDHVRVFTVGLRSGTFDPRALQQIATGTGGSYGEASSTSRLAPIYAALGGRLASEYLLRYRSPALPGAHVSVSVSIAGAGIGSAGYVVPAPSKLAPYHQSALSRFLLSGASLLLLALLVAALLAWVVVRVLRNQAPSVVDRVRAFAAPETKPESQAKQDSERNRFRAHVNPTGVFGRYRARLASEFEIAEITIRPDMYLLTTILLTVIATVVLFLISPPLALLAVLVPVLARGWVTRQLDTVRNAFAYQLPSTLQLLASALRSGHSFSGALSVVVDQAPKPSSREFRIVLTDDQLGIPAEDALRRVAERMANREMEQVALLAELQRIAGGNSAEVLDTVVETIRERGDLRLLARTLTTQGRMARWILTLMPVALGLFLWAAQPTLIKPFVQSSYGEVALVICALMAVAGSFWIKRIVEIKV
jgi:Flp pilus assembly protein TadB